MAGNAFDKAARYAAKLDPVGFLGWALGRPPSAFAYREWLDTRLIPFPGGDDRTGDTVAGLDNHDAGGVPLAVAVEFLLEPDPLMFGRMMVYLGGIWLGKKPDPERGSRYSVTGVVVYLTGRGNASRQFEWAEAGVKTELLLREWGMQSELAADLLGGIETGAVSHTLLPWIPLMTGADQAGIVEVWMRLAGGVPVRGCGRITPPWLASSPTPPGGKTSGPNNSRGGTCASPVSSTSGSKKAASKAASKVFEWARLSCWKPN